MKGPYLGFKPASSAPEAALVTTIPGFNGTLPSKHYSGYVTLDESHGKRLFYYFVESKRNSAKDPIVLWLNGGPGCSSFDGFIYEHGPFNFEARKPRGSLPKLYLNPYSWSKVSSVLYLDSPTGVGFSYSGYESDYITGDLKTSSDSHSFLLKWFELYPEFISNPFYISGESYAGVYVPTLPHEVAQGIATGVKPILNFKMMCLTEMTLYHLHMGWVLYRMSFLRQLMLNATVTTSYKVRVPVKEAIILDETYERCLLVKGWKGTIWCFPRGKKSKDEEDHKCAIREVLEEMGFNVSILLNKDDHIEMIFRQQRVRLYIIAGVKDDTYFAPQTMKEIISSFIYPIVWVSSFIYLLENARRREGQDCSLRSPCNDSESLNTLYRRSNKDGKNEEEIRSNKDGKKEEEISRATFIWRAANLPMYIVAVTPTTVGTASAYLESGHYSLEHFFILLPKRTSSAMKVVGVVEATCEGIRVGNEHGCSPMRVSFFIPPEESLYWIRRSQQEGMIWLMLTLYATICCYTLIFGNSIVSISIDSNFLS